ncbi:MAG: protein kinase domain-containing protein [Actinopolymorphaceae bacterium]
MQPPAPGDPDRIGDYQILARLGEGGMGVVYLGQTLGGRKVAVKVIRSRFAGDPEYRARFRREVVAARAVSGLFTAPVIDAGPDARPPWLVTSYLPGVSLWEAVATWGAMPSASVRLLAVGLAEALVGIHRAGVVHRDLKPGNVMLTAGGPRVIDFGIARPSDATAITQAGMVVGSIGFMSPEQASAGGTGPGSDVFSLGAVLVYAATGREPFAAESPGATLGRVVRAEADLRGLDDHPVHDAIRSCLRRRPEERPSAADLLERLVRLDPGTESLQGTGWLPPELAQEVDRRAGEALGLSRPGDSTRKAAGGAAGGGEPPPGQAATPAALGAETLEPAARAGGPGPVQAEGPGAAEDPRMVEGPGAADAPAARSSSTSSRRPSRRALISTGAGLAVAGLVATPTAVTLWRNRGTDPSAGSGSPAGRGARSGSPSGSPSDSVLSSASGRATRSPAGPPPQAEPRWKVRVAGPDSDSYPNLGVADGMVLAWNDSHVRGIDPHTGDVRWTRVANETLGGIAGGVAYVIGAERSAAWQVSAIDATSNATRWAYKPSTGEYLWHGPAATGPVVCFGGDRIRALGVRDGRQRWTADVPADNGLAAGVGLVAAVGSRLVAVDVRDGRTSWTYPVDEGLYPHVGSGHVFLCDGSSTLHAVRTDDGSLAWQRPGSDSSFGLQLGDGVLYLSTIDGNVFALDAATGEEVWSRRLGKGEGASFRQPNALRLVGDRLYAACPNRTVYALDAADGLVLWTYDIDPTLSSGPVAAAGLVFVGTSGHVQALVPPSGGDRGGTRAR